MLKGTQDSLQQNAPISTLQIKLMTKGLRGSTPGDQDHRKGHGISNHGIWHLGPRQSRGRNHFCSHWSNQRMLSFQNHRMKLQASISLSHTVKGVKVRFQKRLCNCFCPLPNLNTEKVCTLKFLEPFLLPSASSLIITLSSASLALFNVSFQHHPRITETSNYLVALAPSLKDCTQ